MCRLFCYPHARLLDLQLLIVTCQLSLKYLLSADFESFGNLLERNLECTLVTDPPLARNVSQLTNMVCRDRPPNSFSSRSSSSVVTKSDSLELSSRLSQLNYLGLKYLYHMSDLNTSQKDQYHVLSLGGNYSMSRYTFLRRPTYSWKLKVRNCRACEGILNCEDAFHYNSVLGLEDIGVLSDWQSP